MYIIPSLYIRDQKTVVLATGGSPFNENPIEMAKELASVGAEMIYIVDLNTPPAGSSPNLQLIEDIVKGTGLKVQIAAHIRSADVVERYIKAGAERVVLGIIGYQKPDFLRDICEKCPGKIAMQIDVRRGKVVIKGWTVAANKTPLDYAEQFKGAGVFTIVYSDVEEEGKISPADIKRTRDFLRKSPIPTILTAEVSSISEIELVLGLESPRLIGTIIGKAMYSGMVDIASTITHAKEKTPEGMDEPTLIP